MIQHANLYEPFQRIIYRIPKISAMANFSAPAAAFFCFFTLSLALTPLHTPENDDVATTVSFPFPDANPTVNSNPTEPVNAEDNHLSLSTAVPLNTISLRPFYRRFSKFTCHHRHKFYKADPMRPLEIPYGNDMLVSAGENSDFQNPETLHGGSWQRVKLPHHHHHHHHDEDSDSDDEDEDDRIKKMALKRHHHHRHHHDEDSDSDDEDEDDRIKEMALKRHHFGGFDAEKKLKILKRHFRYENTEEEEHHHKKERHGFMTRVRKFFDHYF